eukprot:1153629-Pelagomonas_calceolata.AAC.1
MERADLGIGTSEQHMFFILYVIGITDNTDRRNAMDQIASYEFISGVQQVGCDQPRANQPNDLAEGYPYCNDCHQKEEG